MKGYGFRQVFFQFHAQPVLQRRVLLRRNIQGAQSGATLVVIPANFGIKNEEIDLAGQREYNFTWPPGFNAGESAIAMPPSLRFTTWQLDFTAVVHNYRGNLTGQRNERRRSRTIDPNATFNVRPTEFAVSGFSSTKFGLIWSC